MGPLTAEYCRKRHSFIHCRLISRFLRLPPSIVTWSWRSGSLSLGLRGPTMMECIPVGMGGILNWTGTLFSALSLLLIQHAPDPYGPLRPRPHNHTLPRIQGSLARPIRLGRSARSRTNLVPDRLLSRLHQEIRRQEPHSSQPRAHHRRRWRRHHRHPGRIHCEAVRRVRLRPSHLPAPPTRRRSAHHARRSDDEPHPER